MIDIFTVVVPHVLMAIAIWRLLFRDDLDDDPILPNMRRLTAQHRRRAEPGEGSPGA